MRNLAQEAIDTMRQRRPPEARWTLDRDTALRVQAEINAGLEESVRRSREIQAQSEIEAAKLFLTV
jgi:hypothetical protein